MSEYQIDTTRRHVFLNGLFRYFLRAGIGAVTGAVASLFLPCPSALAVQPYDTILNPVDGETYSAAVTVQFLAIDADSDFCTATVEFSKDSGSTWLTATLSGTSVISNLYCPTLGDTKTVVWLSKTDLPDTITSRVQLRIAVADASGTGPADTTQNIGIDNEKPALVTGVQAVANLSGAETGVYVTWNTSAAPDSSGYHVFRSATTDSRLSSRINASLLVDTRGCLDTTASQGDSQFYYVVASDTHGNLSDSSALWSAPNVDVVRPRPGDTVVYSITVRNNGYAPAKGVVVYDYLPANTVFADSSTAASAQSGWSIEYRVTGGGGEDVWQTPMADSATMVRFTRNNRMDPSTATPSDTLTLKIIVK